MTGNLIVIKGMHRLTILLHHIVGDIHQIVDGTDSCRRKSSLHPLGGWSDLNILYHTGTVPRAQIRVFHRYFHIIVGVLIISRWSNYWRNKLLPESSCRFPRNTDNTEAVHTIRGDLILKIHIIQPQSLDGITAHLSVLREDIDTVFRSFRVHFPAGTQLLDGTHHAVGFDTTQLTFFDLNTAGCHLSIVPAGYPSAVQNHRDLVSLMHIRRSGYDLYCLRANVHLADDQFIRVRMTFYLFNLANDDLFQILIRSHKALYLGSGQGHCIRIFLRRYVQLGNIGFNP